MLNGSQHHHFQQLLSTPNNQQNNGFSSSTSSATTIMNPSTSSNNASASTSTNLSRFDTLEQTLDMFVENARHLCVIVSDFPGGGGGGSTAGSSTNALTASVSSPALSSTAFGGGGGGGSSSTSSSTAASNSQTVMNQKLQTLVGGLQELDQAKHHFQDVKIPLELFDQFVDAGRNPQSYTKECMERTLIKNKQINGKIELYKKFRAHLLKEISDEFPKEAMQYRAIREQTTTISASSTASGTNQGGSSNGNLA